MHIRLATADEHRQPVVDVPPNEQLTVALDQPGGTGYSWQLDADASRYRVVDERIEADQSDETFGGTRSQVFTIEPLVPGTTDLVFRLAAPWEDEPVREQRLRMRSAPE